MRALALELATSRWASQFDLVLVGFGADLERFERVTVTGSAGPVLADISWRRLRHPVRLDDRGCTSAPEARFLDGGTAWDPLVVICGPAVSPVDAAALASGGATGADGIAVVVLSGGADDLGASRTLRAVPTGAAPMTELFGSLLDPQQVSAEDVDRTVRLVGVAEPGRATDQVDIVSAEDVDGYTPSLEDARCDGTDDPEAGGPARGPADQPSGADLPVAETGTGRSASHQGANGQATGTVSPLVVREPVSVVSLLSGSEGPKEEAPTPAGPLSPTSVDGGMPVPGRAGGQLSSEVEVEVSVLGPVAIHGAARAFTRAWALELVVYLAMHPAGASNDSWSTALWPDRVMAPSSLHSTASVARRSLGKARDGSDHLPRSHGRLALGRSVGTDWDRFLLLSRRDDPGEWKAALELVRGRPFEGLRSTDWAILDGTAPSMESTIVDLSGRLAGSCLRAGDPRGAEWSARRGLLVSPYDERLYRMLLRAADAAGNPGGVESVMTELVRVVADEIEPVESVHPSTLALYRSLSRRGAPTM